MIIVPISHCAVFVIHSRKYKFTPQTIQLINSDYVRVCLGGPLRLIDRLVVPCDVDPSV